jgi:hypothetical protein
MFKGFIIIEYRNVYQQHKISRATVCAVGMLSVSAQLYVGQSDPNRSRDTYLHTTWSVSVFWDMASCSLVSLCRRYSTVKQLRVAVFHTVRGQADCDATMEHVTLRRTHQQSNCKKCLLWGPPRGYVRRADWSCKLVRRLWVGLQAGSPGPWREGHGQSSTVSSGRLVSPARKLQGRQE